MTADEILFAIVSANAGVGALIGAGAACKLYPDEIPQDTPMPAATYCMVVGRPENVMDTSPRATNERIQIDAWADDNDGAKALAWAIEQALQSTAAMNQYGAGIRCIAYNGRRVEPDTKRWRDSRDFSFWTSR